MNNQFDWVAVFPGIELLDVTRKDHFISDITEKYNPITIETKVELIGGWPTAVEVTNEKKLYPEMIKTNEYLQLQPEIQDLFFKTYLAELIKGLSQQIPGFVLIDKKDQENHITKLIPNFFQDSLSHQSTLNAANFVQYAAEFIKNNTDTDAKLITSSIKNKMNDALNLALAFLIPFPSQVKNSLVNNFGVVFDLNMAMNEKVRRLIQYFDSLYQKNKRYIENGYQEPAFQNVQDSLKDLIQFLLSSKELKKITFSTALTNKLGFLLQDPGLLTEILNLLTIAENAETAGNVRKLLHSLYLPLQPLAKEWFVILPAEKNWAMIAFRFLVPIMIASVIVALGFLLISSIVSMPAIFELLMIVPLAYFGFVVASGYISLRDYSHESIRNGVYGKYNTSEYRVNAFLKSAFGQVTATQIRDYYVEEFKKCDRLIQEFKKIHLVAHSDSETTYLKQNGLARKIILLEEWSTLLGSVENPTKDACFDLIKKRVKLDSINAADVNKPLRDKYLSDFCQALVNSNYQLPSHHAFFKQPNNKKFIAEHRSAQENMAILLKIHEATQSLNSP